MPYASDHRFLSNPVWPIASHVNPSEQYSGYYINSGYSDLVHSEFHPFFTSTPLQTLMCRWR